MVVVDRGPEVDVLKLAQRLAAEGVGVGGLAPHSGDIAVKIATISPDGTFEGRLDFFSPGKCCQAMNEPIKEAGSPGTASP